MYKEKTGITVEELKKILKDNAENGEPFILSFPIEGGSEDGE